MNTALCIKVLLQFFSWSFLSNIKLCKAQKLRPINIDGSETKDTSFAVINYGKGKTTSLSNSKLPPNGLQNGLPLNEKYRELKVSISPLILDLSTRIFGNLLGLASLCQIQMKSPKTIYWKENCQITSHRNSVHSSRRGMKRSKTLLPWYRNLTMFSLMHVTVKHFLTAFFLSFYPLNE